jgi:hypothetical protein
MTDKTPSKALAAMGGSSSDPAKAILKGALSGIPLIGGVVSEIVGQIIPDQRLDRLERYVIHLADELQKLGAGEVAGDMKKPENVDLFEDGAFAAAKALTDEKRERIARLVAYGISGDEQARLEAKRLLNLLAALDDDQVIILASYLMKNQRNDDFRKAHETVFASSRVHMGSTRQEHDVALVRGLAREELIRLGLLRERFKKPSKGQTPELDEKTGRMKVEGRELSSLGRLLLRRLGLAQEGEA